jgi:hypothetical protein
MQKWRHFFSSIKLFLAQNVLRCLGYDAWDIYGSKPDIATLISLAVSLEN